MKHLLRTAILLWALMAALAAGAFTLGETTWQPPAILAEKPDCRLPCWEGVRPGQTAFYEAGESLADALNRSFFWPDDIAIFNHGPLVTWWAKSPQAGELSLEKVAISFNWNDPETSLPERLDDRWPPSSSPEYLTSTAEFVTLVLFEERLTLGDAMAMVGAPAGVFVQPAYFLVDFPRQGMALEVWGAYCRNRGEASIYPPPGPFAPSSPVREIFLRPGADIPWQNSADYKPWSGFGSGRYCAP